MILKILEKNITFIYLNLNNFEYIFPDEIYNPSKRLNIKKRKLDYYLNN